MPVCSQLIKLCQKQDLNFLLSSKSFVLCFIPFSSTLTLFQNHTKSHSLTQTSTTIIQYLQIPLPNILPKLKPSTSSSCSSSTILIHNCHRLICIMVMQQQKAKPSIRAKISSYFRMLCGYPTEPIKPQPQQHEDIDHRPTLKRKRLTYLLDRALVKLSRKNVTSEQFSAKQQLQEEVEKHLAQRLSKITLAIFEGGFGEQAVRTVFFPIILMPNAPPPCEYVSPYNQIVTNHHLTLRHMTRGVEAWVVKVEGEGDVGSAIEAGLKRLQGLAEHLVFVCPGEVGIGHLQELFVLYREEYMFQVERVMALDRCVRLIVYASRSQTFLAIDRGSLIEFCIDELSKRDQSFDRQHLACVLDRLFQAGLHVQVAVVLGELLVTTAEVFEFDKEFLMMMQERYTYSFPIIRRVSDARARKGATLPANNVPKFHQNTPLFGMAEASSIHGKLSQTGSLYTRKNLAISFCKTISRNMGEWQQ